MVESCWLFVSARRKNRKSYFLKMELLKIKNSGTIVFYPVCFLEKGNRKYKP